MRAALLLGLLLGAGGIGLLLQQPGPAGYGLLGAGVLCVGGGLLRKWTTPPPPLPLRGPTVGFMGAMGMGGLHRVSEALPSRAGDADEISLKLVPRQEPQLQSAGRTLPIDDELRALIGQFEAESKAVPRLTILAQREAGSWQVNVKYE